MPRRELFGTDGGHIGTITVSPQGGKAMAVAQVNITVCSWEKFDQWWHNVYSHTREIFEEMEKTEGEK